MFFRKVSFTVLGKPWFYSSLLLGIAFGLFVYGYWLVDFFPPMSRRIFIYVGVLSIAATAVYFLILEKWLMPCISRMTKIFRLQFILWSMLGGVFLMFAGTAAWQNQFQYVSFLLPSQSLEISIPSQQPSSTAKVAVSWLQTSEGEVSFDSIDYRGWMRVDNSLVLQDLSNNSLSWNGRTGEKAVIIFQDFSPGLHVNISWNGALENVTLTPGSQGIYQVGHKFELPFYASRYMILLLGFVSYSFLAAVIVSFIWDKRSILAFKFSESLTYSPDRKLLPGLLVVTGLIFVALMLRVFNLEGLSPYVDEYAHLNAAKELISGASIGAVYQRGLWIVTLPVALAFRIFGLKLWAARLVGVLFNALAILPLFLIARRINRPVAIISGILYATSPWMIGVSRSVREYAYHPFYFYWIAYGLIILIERFPDHFSFKDVKKLFEPRFYLPALVLLFPLYYGLVIDPLSTFKVILGAYCIFCLFILRKFDFRNKLTRWLFLGAVGFGLTAVIYAISRSTLLITDQPLRMFFPNPQQQWYYNRIVIIMALTLGCAVLSSIFYYRKNHVPLFILAILLLQLAFFMFFFNRYFRPRYLITTQIWFIIVLAVGVYGLWLVLNIILQKRIALVTSMILVAVVFNFGQVLLPSLISGVTEMPITTEYHGDAKKANDFVLDKVKDGDVLISTYYGAYIRFVGKPIFSKAYHYAYRNQSKIDIVSIILKHDHGWIILDDRTGIEHSLMPLDAFVVNDKKIEYLGQFGNQFVWRWYIIE